MTADVPALSTSADVEAVLAEHANCEINPGSGLGAVTSGVDVWSCGIEVPFVDDLDVADRKHLAAALSTPPTEGSTVTEWGARDGDDPEVYVVSSQARLDRLVRDFGMTPIGTRQRTSYPDRMTEWTEVTP